MVVTEEDVGGFRLSLMRGLSRLCSNQSSPHLTMDINTTNASNGVELPVEILRLIFEHVALALDGDPIKHKIFPYNIARVCTLWRDILGDYPEFWTNIHVIIEDTTPVLVAELKRYMTFSKNLPIRIQVVRHHYPTVKDTQREGTGDSSEIQTTRALIDVLRPHFIRCTSIAFAVIHSESLPSFSTDILPLSSNLKTLLLSSHRSNTDSCLTEYTDEHLEPASNLMVFVLSGKSAFDACLHPTTLFSKERIPLMGFDNYHSNNNDEAGKRFLTSLSLKSRGARDLALSEIDIPFPGTEFAASWALYSPILTLTSIPEGMLRLIFQATHPNITNISICDCTLNDDLPLLSLPTCEEMSLREVSGELGAVIALWDGRFLTFDNCPSFTDPLVEALTARIERGRYTLLESIRIQDCKGFSPRTLLDMAHMMGRMIWPCTITVSGSAPKLSHDEAATLASLHGVIRWES